MPTGNAKPTTDTTTVDNTKTPVLVPSLAVVTQAHADLRHPAINIASGKSEYVLVEVDKNGVEVPGSQFTVSETTFRTSFAHNSNFIVKKNPQ